MKASEALSLNKNVAPPEVEVIRPDEWDSLFSGRVSYEVAVGIRRLSEAALQGVLEEASRDVKTSLGLEDLDDSNPAHVTAYNGAVMAIAVARAICDPNDVTKPLVSLPMAEDTIRYALIPGAIARLYHVLERITISTGAAHRLADDSEVALLKEYLVHGWDYHLEPTKSASVRRLLAYCLDEIEAG